MEQGKPRLARLTAIITQLQGGKIVTARQLANRFEVSIRTIYRDIRTLEQSGIPIYTEEGKGYSLVSGYRLPPVMFTEQEANALITAASLLSSNSDVSLAESYQRAITKIRAVLPEAAKARASLLDERLFSRRSERDTAPNTTLLMPLQLALTQRMVVRISYTNEAGNLSQRSIEPFALYTTKGNWILLAYCRLRKAFRAFRLDRISTYQTLSKTFPPHQLTIEEYLAYSRTKQIYTPDIPLSQPAFTFARSLNQSTMEKLVVAPFKLIGLTVRTSNTDPVKTAQAIGGLWQQMLGKQLAERIPNKADSALLLAYTEFESDHTGEYTAVLGCKVDSLQDIPSGMRGFEFPGGNYQKLVCKGDLSKGAVYGAWSEIWSMDLPRTYTVDFEVYGPKAMNPAAAEVDILVAVT